METKAIPIFTIDDPEHQELVAMMTSHQDGLHVTYMPGFQPTLPQIRTMFGDAVITSIKYAENQDKVQFDKRKVSEFKIIALLRQLRKEELQ